VETRSKWQGLKQAIEVTAERETNAKKIFHLQATTL
jgi:hypothetical protein